MRERLPGVVNTKRKKLSRNQIAERYLKSIEGNRDIDINKPPRVVSKERIEARLPAVLRNAWPKASLHRNVEMPCYNGGSQLKRNVAEGNAALGLYTSWQPVKNDYFEYIWAMDEYRLWAIENNFLDPYSRRGEGELHHPVVDFIGPSPVCGVDHLLLIELSLFDQLKTYYGFDKIGEIPKLNGAAGCLDMAVYPNFFGITNKERRCVYLAAGDQIEKIDEFLRSTENQDNRMIFAEPDVIEAWGTTNKYLQEQNMTAFAIRRKDWRMYKYGYPSLGAAVGMAIIGGFAFKRRAQITDCANGIKQAVKRCFGYLPTTEADDPAGDTNQDASVINISQAQAKPRHLRPDVSDIEVDEETDEEEMEEKPVAIEKTGKSARNVIIDGGSSTETEEEEVGESGSN